VGWGGVGGREKCCHFTATSDFTACSVLRLLALAGAPRVLLCFGPLSGLGKPCGVHMGPLAVRLAVALPW